MTAKWLLVLVLWPAAVQAQGTRPDTGYSRSFQCPESLATPEARQAAIVEFLNWAKGAHSDWTLTDLITYRMNLLVQHRCDATLANIRAGSAAVAPQSLRYRCSDGVGSRSFADAPEDGCVTIPLESGWVSFVANSQVLLDIMPSTAIREEDGVKLWAHFYLAEPLGVPEGWWYDEMKAISKFYCGKRQTKLLQGAYWLGGSLVHETAAGEVILEEIEPGTISEELYVQLCRN